MMSQPLLKYVSMFSMCVDCNRIYCTRHVDIDVTIVSGLQDVAMWLQKSFEVL